MEDLEEEQAEMVVEALEVVEDVVALVIHGPQLQHVITLIQMATVDLVSPHITTQILAEITDQTDQVVIPEMPILIVVLMVSVVLLNSW